MGKIIKNGITYGGTSTIAGNISYDNSTSQLNSQTVQNAITELKELADAATSQVTTLPAASAANLNKIYQYIGTTNANYTNGMFYKCVYDTSVNPAVYKWQIIDTSVSSADKVTYDNTNSGLTAANIQAAIDELNTNDVGYAWAGTQAEWNTLTSAQKAAYDGKEVLITDDSGSNEGVISSLEARIVELGAVAKVTVEQYNPNNELPTGTVTFVRCGNVVWAKGDLYFDVTATYQQGATTGSWRVCDIPQGFGSSTRFSFEIEPHCYQYTLATDREKFISDAIKGIKIGLGPITSGGLFSNLIEFSQIERENGNPLKSSGYISTHFYTSWYTDQPFPTNN